MSCPHCGADHTYIKLVYCEKCGVMVRSFCVSCGKLLSKRQHNCTKETMFCPRCGVDDRQIMLVYCEECSKLIKKVCAICGETISEQLCRCTREEVPGDSTR